MIFKIYKLYPGKADDHNNDRDDGGLGVDDHTYRDSGNIQDIQDIYIFRYRDRYI